VTVPAGYYPDGSPVSVLFLGKPFSEAELLGLAYDDEQATHLRVEPELTRTHPSPPPRSIVRRSNMLPPGWSRGHRGHAGGARSSRRRAKPTLNLRIDRAGRLRQSSFPE
jgi:hypothetical protein